MNRSTPGLPVHHKLPEFTQTHAHRVGDAIQPSHSLSSPSPPAPNPSQHQGLLQWVNSSHEVAKLLEFQLQNQSLQWTPRTYLFQDGLVGSPCSPRDSQESSPTPQFKSINFSVLSFLHSPTLTSTIDHWKNNNSTDQKQSLWTSLVSEYVWPSKNIKINSERFSDLLDPGSDITIISKHLWPKSWPIEKVCCQIAGIPQTKMQEVYQSVQIYPCEGPEGQPATLRPYVVSEWSQVTQLCLTLCHPVACSPTGSSVHGILQARILEWVAISFSLCDKCTP